MAMNPRDLLVYELGIARDAERTGRIMITRIRDQIRNKDLIEMLRCVERESEQHLAHIGECFDALGTTPLETPSETVNGMSARFETFARLEPTCELFELFGLSTVRVFLSFGITIAKGLLIWAELLGETRCAGCIRESLMRKEQTLSNLERVGRELSERIIAPVPAS